MLNIIYESFDAISITPNYILQLHKILYSHMNNPAAGRIKSVQNYISATYPAGSTRKMVAEGELKREGNGKNIRYFRLKFFETLPQ